MDDGWGLHFVRRTRKSELIGRNQSPVGTLGSKTQELVAPSGCCLASGIDVRRSERVGSSKQGYNDQTHFCPPFSFLLGFVKLHLTDFTSRLCRRELVSRRIPLLVRRGGREAAGVVAHNES